MPSKPVAKPPVGKSKKQETMEAVYAQQPPTRPAPPPVEDVPAEDDGDEEISFNIDAAVGLIPANTPCICTVTSFAPTVSQAGNNMYNVTLLIDSSPYEPAIGRKLWRSLVQTDNAQVFTALFLKALGLDPHGTYKRRAIEGLQLGVVVGIKPEQNGYDAKNEPKQFKTLEQIQVLIDKYNVAHSNGA